jgi:hypothetical protein
MLASAPFPNYTKIIKLNAKIKIEIIIVELFCALLRGWNYFSLHWSSFHYWTSMLMGSAQTFLLAFLSTCVQWQVVHAVLCCFASFVRTLF